MFPMVFPSTFSSSRLYIQQQVYVSNRYCYLLLYVVFNSWWRTERPSETCRVAFQK